MGWGCGWISFRWAPCHGQGCVTAGACGKGAGVPEWWQMRLMGVPPAGGLYRGGYGYGTAQLKVRAADLLGVISKV